MKTSLAIPLLTVLWLLTACNKEADRSVSRIENTDAPDLTTLSDDDLTQNLEKLKFVLSDARRASDNHFVGSRPELNKYLADLRSVFPEDQYAVTWMPDSKGNDEEVEGTVQIKALPGHLERVEKLVSEFEVEVRRRESANN